MERTFALFLFFIGFSLLLACAFVDKAVAAESDSPTHERSSAIDAKAHYLRANSLVKQNRFPEAQAEYQVALALSKDEMLTQYCHQALDQLSTSTSASSGPSAQSPRSSEHVNSEKRPYALVDRLPQSAVWHKELADQLAKRGRYDDARAQLEIACFLSKDGSERNAYRKSIESIEKKKLGNATSANDREIIYDVLEGNLSPEDRGHLVVLGSDKYTNRSVQDVLWALSIIPRRLKDVYWGRDITIYLDWSVAEARKKLQEPNSDGENFFGLTEGKRTIVGETRDGACIASPGRVLLHELGHSFDWKNKDNPSNSFEFAIAVEQDYANPLSRNYRWAKQEIFAQLFMFAMCKQAHADAGACDDIEIALPRTWQFMKRLLSEYGVN